MKELRNEVMSILEGMVDEDMSLMDVCNEVIIHGCISGIVTELIYYYQTEEFFDRHKKAINELAHEMSEEIYGNPYEIYKHFTYECSKNTLAWFAFEEVTSQIYNELFE